MAYRYITDNNLYEKQTYMYSEYKGMTFIKEYLDSRKNYLRIQEAFGKEDFSKNRTKRSQVNQALQNIYESLAAGNYGKETVSVIDGYVKSFEVRKRIYTGYDNIWKPLKNAEFEEYESYLLLAACLPLMYRYTKCLKYFNCLLKLEDTLLSVRDKLESPLQELLCHIIHEELDIFYQLAEENGVDVEERK